MTKVHSPARSRKKKPVNNGFVGRGVRILELEPPEDLEFGNVLRRYLEQVGLTADDLIEYLGSRRVPGDTHSSEDAVKSWLKNRCPPDSQTFPHVEDFFSNNRLGSLWSLRLARRWRTSKTLKFAGAVGCAPEKAFNVIDARLPSSVIIVRLYCEDTTDVFAIHKFVR